MPVKKTMAKKPASAKGKTAPKTKASTNSPANTGAPAKRPVGRPRKDAVPYAPEPLKPEFELLSEEKHGKLRIQGMSYVQLQELTGIQISTEAFIIALELLRGGRDRQEINDRVRDLLPRTTSQGTPKPVPNLVSGVLKKLQAQGFGIKGDWKVTKPSSRV